MTHDLLAATVRLADAVAAENAALRAMDLTGAAALAEEKRAASAAFDAARKVAPAGPARLRPAVLRLLEQAEENRLLLERALRVQSRVLGVIAGAARAASPAPRYGRSGAYAGSAPAGWALSARA